MGGKILKGVKKNLSESYNQKINTVFKDQLKNKEDVPVAEAFEFYMLKKFFNIELNTVSQKMLNFWEKDFTSSIDKHLEFLNKNLEDQNNYSLKFSQILESMDIFNSNNDENNKDNDDKNEQQDNKAENNDDNQSDGKDEKNKQDESQTNLDAGFDLSDQQIDEKLEDSNSSKRVQKM